jgi:hypothetical protein
VEFTAVPGSPWKAVTDTLTPGSSGFRVCNA